MPAARRARPAPARTPSPRTPRRPYHHGDLRRALLDEAIRTINRHGVEALTLRAVGTRLGVSRTALYRHFADKSALLAAVGREGFRTFRQALEAAWHAGSGGRDGFDAMGRAYVRFAVEHPAYYRVMFGGFLDGCASDPELLHEARAAHQVLVDAIVTRRRAHELRQDDPLDMAHLVWASVHGLAMLAIDGQTRGSLNQAVAYALGRLGASLEVALPAGPRARRPGDVKP